MSIRIQGKCPACDWKGTIFVGDGGYLTCSRDTCPNPCAPSEALGVKFPEMAGKAPACPTCAGTGWYRGRLCPEYCNEVMTQATE